MYRKEETTWMVMHAAKMALVPNTARRVCAEKGMCQEVGTARNKTDLADRAGQVFLLKSHTPSLLS